MKYHSTINDVFEAFMASRKRRATTSSLYRYAFSLLGKHLKSLDYPIAEMTVDKMSQFCSWLTKHYAANSANIIFTIIKSMFAFAERHGYISENPCSTIYEQHLFRKQKHHQALSRAQFEVCEASFWDSLETKADHKEDEMASCLFCCLDSSLFAQMCFVLGFYLQGLSFVDLLLLKMSMIREVITENGHCFIIETARKKTGKGVKIMIPQEHTKRHRLFSAIFREAEKRHSIHLISPIDSFAGDDTYIYNKVRQINGTVNRHLKKWWSMLNGSGLESIPVNIKTTSYYSCRHTFATLYIESPEASLGELASLMGRNAEYIDTYIKEITADDNLLRATDKVFGKAKTDEKMLMRQLLDNQNTIISMLAQILSHY